MTLQEIKDLKIPTNDDMNNMTVEQLIEWREKLRKHYEHRDYYKEHDYNLYYKARSYQTFEKMTWNLQNGLDRWQGISNYEQARLI